jgi:hypothetical protein
MRNAFDKSPGLCVPHFLSALRTKAEQSVQQYLVKTERQKCRQLLHDLSEFCRKHDYRFSHEGLASEGSSWIRAVAMMVGREGIIWQR